MPVCESLPISTSSTFFSCSEGSFSTVSENAQYWTNIDIFYQAKNSLGPEITGLKSHECELYYFRARYYSGELGRFINRDPLLYVDGMSLYRAYFVVNGVDPSGMCCPGDTRNIGIAFTFTGTCSGAPPAMTPQQASQGCRYKCKGKRQRWQWCNDGSWQNGGWDIVEALSWKLYCPPPIPNLPDVGEPNYDPTGGSDESFPEPNTANPHLECCTG